MEGRMKHGAEPGSLVRYREARAWYWAGSRAESSEAKCDGRATAERPQAVRPIAWANEDQTETPCRQSSKVAEPPNPRHDSGESRRGRRWRPGGGRCI